MKTMTELITKKYTYQNLGIHLPSRRLVAYYYEQRGKNGTSLEDKSRSTHTHWNLENVFLSSGGLGVLLLLVL